MCLINATCCCVGVKCVFVYRVRGIHENTGLRLAGWELFRRQLAPILAAECILSRVDTLFAHPVEHGAERIARGSIANNACPFGNVPGYAEGEVLGDFHLFLEFSIYAARRLMNLSFRDWIYHFANAESGSRSST